MMIQCNDDMRSVCVRTNSNNTVYITADAAFCGSLFASNMVIDCALAAVQCRAVQQNSSMNRVRARRRHANKYVKGPHSHPHAPTSRVRTYHQETAAVCCCARIDRSACLPAARCCCCCCCVCAVCAMCRINSGRCYYCWKNQLLLLLLRIY